VGLGIFKNQRFKLQVGEYVHCRVLSFFHKLFCRGKGLAMGPFRFEISEADKNKKEKECQLFMGPFGFEISEADKNTKEKE
jgi:hypothetical protein